MKGLVIKKNADLFAIESKNGEIVEVKSRGNLREKGVCVGDIVEFDKVVQKVLPRKNILIRPPLANIDKMFICISPIPKPDFLLVDKMIIYCLFNKIEPILLINKTDLLDETNENEIIKNYHKVLKIIKTSAISCQYEELKKEIIGVCALAGQSAVGKSSLINALTQQEVAKVGDLSKKIERGKQTTRLVQLYKVEKGYIADTAGFSMLSIPMVAKIKDYELTNYYPEFVELKKNCKFRSCLHQNETDCAIIDAVNKGMLSEQRYQNYLKILEQIKQSKKY